MALTWLGSRRRILVLGASVLSALGVNRWASAQEDPAEDTRPNPADEVTEDGYLKVVGPASLLEEQGQVLTDKVLIVKDAEGATVGVSPFCTHRYCVLNWDAENQEFVCPCHLSNFDIEGKVTAGPATEDLLLFNVRVTDNVFEIRPKGV